MSRCRACNAEILWVTTHLGKPMPVDLHASPDGNLVVTMEDDGMRSRPVEPLLDRGPFWLSHFATCKFADSFRKKGRPG